ncbi:hypothetical protein KJ903_00130, partial [Patescibacteria group bacterium]|nr:hypothetical protein [Patescibacteria group bacterium]
MNRVLAKLFPLVLSVLFLAGCQTVDQNQVPESWAVLSWDGDDYGIKDRPDQSLSSPSPPASEWWADIDYDGDKERTVLENNRISVAKNGQIFWQTDPAWQVGNVIIDDLNQDGEIEINFSVEKIRGEYRANRLFKESNDWTSCFYIYKWRDGAIRPAWLSSPLDEPIHQTVAHDLNQDNKKELVVLEKDQLHEDYAQYISVWSWYGWGFSNDWRSEEGEFNNVVVD